MLEPWNDAKFAQPGHTERIQVFRKSVLRVALAETKPKPTVDDWHRNSSGPRPLPLDMHPSRAFQAGCQARLGQQSAGRDLLCHWWRGPRLSLPHISWLVAVACSANSIPVMHQGPESTTAHRMQLCSRAGQQGAVVSRGSPADAQPELSVALLGRLGALDWCVPRYWRHRK